MNLKPLRDYIRLCLTQRRKPDPAAIKRIEELKFLGANLCPDCGVDLSLDNFRHTKDEMRIYEYITCSACGVKLVLSNIRIN